MLRATLLATPSLCVNKVARIFVRRCHKHGAGCDLIVFSPSSEEKKRIGSNNTQQQTEGLVSTLSKMTMEKLIVLICGSAAAFTARPGTHRASLLPRGVAADPVKKSSPPALFGEFLACGVALLSPHMETGH
jgi:hypothetical protein